MINKQIKDGIDVSQCKCYSVEDNSCNNTLSGRLPLIKIKSLFKRNYEKR